MHLDTEDTRQDYKYDCVKSGENYYETEKSIKILRRLNILATHVEKEQK